MPRRSPLAPLLAVCLVVAAAVFCHASAGDKPADNKDAAAGAGLKAASPTASDCAAELGGKLDEIRKAQSSFQEMLNKLSVDKANTADLNKLATLLKRVADTLDLLKSSSNEKTESAHAELLAKHAEVFAKLEFLDSSVNSLAQSVGAITQQLKSHNVTFAQHLVAAWEACARLCVEAGVSLYEFVTRLVVSGLPTEQQTGTLIAAVADTLRSALHTAAAYGVIAAESASAFFWHQQAAMSEYASARGIPSNYALILSTGVLLVVAGLTALVAVLLLRVLLRLLAMLVCGFFSLVCCCCRRSSASGAGVATGSGKKQGKKKKASAAKKPVFATAATANACAEQQIS